MSLHVCIFIYIYTHTHSVCAYIYIYICVCTYTLASKAVLSVLMQFTLLRSSGFLWVQGGLGFRLWGLEDEFGLRFRR